MNGILKKIIWKVGKISYLLDIVLLPLTITSLTWFRLVKFLGVSKFPISKKLFNKIGILPIVKHYYEPLFDINQLSKILNSKRELSGIDFRVENQIELMSKFNYQAELLQHPINKNQDKYYYQNKSFESGDAELYYSIIREYQPEKIIEIGSGFSTLIAIEAIAKNNNQCSITCIEPYEMEWLESLNLEVIRDKVELLSPDTFLALEADDILFIDSSHIIRPQGDVLFEILEILPKLNQGVMVHFHDIFTPNDYPIKWLTDEFRLWNEQYLLEAFLSNNAEFEIVCSLNLLTRAHPDVVNRAFPIHAKVPNPNPGSFWIRKIA